MRALKTRISTGATGLAVAFALGLATLAPTGQARAEMTPTIDRGHTSVHFSVMHGGFTPTIYQFRTIEKVDFVFNPKDVSKSKISMVIQAASLDSNHAFRDNWARSAAELNVWKYPTITFVSTKVWKTGKNTGKVTGNLTLHGVTKPITADIRYNKAGRHFTGKHWVHGFIATAKFKRSDFGLKAFTMVGTLPWIGDEISLTVLLEQKRAVPK
ncbi:MAG TPA: YceI family protein [Alphaproteobacteria bacterium]|nr:YceI family protein [Alphaproteobacteria bacterium]